MLRARKPSFGNHCERGRRVDTVDPVDRHRTVEKGKFAHRIAVHSQVRYASTKPDRYHHRQQNAAFRLVSHSASSVP